MTLSDDIQLKLFIADAAVTVREREGAFWTLQHISQETGMPVSELFKVFGSKRDMLHFWYEGLTLRYRTMIAELDDYDDLTLSEKLTNMMLSLLSMMEEQDAFVKHSFDSLVFKNQTWHPFKKEVAQLFKEIIEQHDGVSQAARVVLWDEFFEFLAKEFLHVVKFRNKDKSEFRGKTNALVDKISFFVSELLCAKVLDSGMDLFRFFWQEGIIKVDITLPFIGRIKSGQQHPQSQ